MNDTDLKDALWALRGGMERIELRLATLDERQDRFEASLDGAFTVIRSDSQELANTKQTVAYQQDEIRRQGKRVSELVRKVAVQEGTGRVFVAQVSQTWRTVAVAAAAVTALAGLVIALLK